MKRTYGNGSLRQRGSTWYIRYRDPNGRLIEECAQTADREKAENLLKQKVAEVARGEVDVSWQRTTVADLCQLVVADYKLRELRSLSDVEWRIAKHIDPMFGNLRASRFGPNQVRAYVAKRRSADAANATINRELSIIRRGFSLGRRENPPLVAVEPYIPQLEEDNVRHGFIEDPQYRLLLARLPEHLKAAFVVGYHCGNRLGEIRSLRPDQVYLEAGEIRIERSQIKGKKDRVIPIYGDMVEWLKRQLDELPEGCPYLFHYHGRRLGSHLKGWARACADVGLDGLIFHDLRRSAVRNMDRAGIRREVAKAVSGHKTDEMYRRYNIVSGDELQGVGDQMKAFRQREKQKQKAQLKRVK